MATEPVPPPPRVDGGIEGGSGEGGLTVEAPMAPTGPTAPMGPSLPAAPRMLDCREGWRPAETGDYCEPDWPEDETCAGDEALFVGERACTRVGTECGSDGWATGLPASGIVFVRAGAASGGDGTRARPFGTIEEAFEMRGSATTVALAEGRYDEEIEIPAGVTLWGACVAETTIVGSDPLRDDYTVGIGGAGSRLRNLRLEGARVWLYGEESSVEIEDVIFDAVHGWGLRLMSGEAVVRNVVSRHARDTEDGPWNQFFADEGAEVVLDRVVIEDSGRGLGLFDAGTHAEVRDLVVRDIAGDFAFGMNFGAMLDAEGVVIDRASTFSFMVSSDPSIAVMRDVLVRDSANSLVSNFGALLQVERVATIRGGEGLRTDLARSRLEATDVVVRDTEGLAFEAGEEASLTVTRAKVVNAGGHGFLVQLVAHADLTDVDVDGSGRPAVELYTGASATVTRLRSRGATGSGVHVESAAAVLELDDTTIESVLSDGGEGGVGLLLSSASVTATRLDVTGAHESGVVVTGDTASLTLEDLRVSGTLASDAAPASGRGLDVMRGATLSAVRASIERSAAGALAISMGARVTIPDVTIVGTGPEAALAVIEGGSLVSERISVGPADGDAVVIDGAESSITMSDLIVAGAAGDGLAVTGGASATYARMTFDDVRGIALRLDPEARVPAEIADVTVTRAGTAGFFLAHGVAVAMRRVSVSGAGGIGIWAAERGTVIDATDVSITGTSESEPLARGIEIASTARWSSETTIVRDASDVGALAVGTGSDVVLRDAEIVRCALGASVSDGASLELDGFVVTGATRAGIQVGLSGGLDLRRGRVVENAVGANVQDLSFDVRRLTLDEVVFAGNGSDVSVDPIDVPAPTVR